MDRTCVGDGLRLTWEEDSEKGSRVRQTDVKLSLGAVTHVKCRSVYSPVCFLMMVVAPRALCVLCQCSTTELSPRP